VPTVASIQAEVAWEIGSALPGGPDPDLDVKPVIDAIAAQMPALWDNAAASAATAARPNTVTFVALRRLYMKLAAIDALLGARWPKVDVLLGGRSGARPSLNQEFTNLFKMRGSVVAEIKDARKEALAAGGPAGAPVPAAADMLRTAPVMEGAYLPPVPVGQPVNPGTIYPDPNDPAFRGDPRLLPPVPPPDGPGVVP
jgi:hypothetical protein